MSPTAVLIPTTVFTVMLALGTSLQLNVWQNWRRHWPQLLRVELTTCLLVPLVAWTLLSLPAGMALSTEARHAIALMAACPSAPLILRRAGRIGGDASLAGLLQVTAALLAILTVPLLAQLAERVFAVAGWDVRPRHVAWQVGTVQLLPLLVGLLLRRFWPGPLMRLQGPLDRLANGLLMLLLFAVLFRSAPLLLNFALFNGWALLLMALLVLLSLAMGFGMAGGDAEFRTTAALVTGMRNPGLAMLLAGQHAGDLPHVKLGILLYVLITFLISGLALRRFDLRTSRQRDRCQGC
ncbi:MAG: bile acid:sodium symporter [Cyanobacteriota bacterium]|nr:bile acid:sodium symporter [Cyanobacteriota bacterium]